MITTAQMKKLEDKAEKAGITKLDLMERAGKGISDIILKKFGKEKTILFVCYHGNNGGDGFTAARYLAEQGCDVKVLFIGQEEKLANEARVNYHLLKGTDVELLIAEKGIPMPIMVDNAGIVVDCILGIGAKGKLQEPISTYVDEINKVKQEYGAYVISVDIPTGLNPDTGEIHDKTVDADLILAIHDLKPGLRKYKDRVVVVDIGLGSV